MNRLFGIALMLIVAALIVNCGDDDGPTGPPDFTLVGTWIFDSGVVNGESYDIPSDTLIYRNDYTGSYRSEWGIGPYDFNYSLRNDSIFRFRTWGQWEGSGDTFAYRIDDNRLMQIHIDPGETRTDYLTRK